MGIREWCRRGRVGSAISILLAVALCGIGGAGIAQEARRAEVVRTAEVIPDEEVVRRPEVVGGEVPGVSPGAGVEGSKQGRSPVSSASSSGQFLVFGEGLPLRSAFCVTAEEVKKGLLKLLGREDRWESKILIAVKDEPAPGRAVVPRVFALDGGGAHFQLDVVLNANFRQAEFSQQLLRLLLAETLLRGDRARAGKVVSLPPWLAVGIAETIEFRKRARPSARFAAVFKAGKNLGVDEILEADPWVMDSVSREVYDASCCALMETLLSQPNGLVRMRQFLGALEVNTGPVKDLLFRQFPGLGISKNSLDKWWALQMVTLSAGGTFEAMGARETEARLQALLVFEFPEEEKKKKKPFLLSIFSKKEKTPVRPEVVLEPGEEPQPVVEPTITMTLADFEKIMDREDRELPLKDAGRKLQRLKIRAYPLYRPLIGGYEEVLGAMVAGKKKNVREAIEALALSRTETLSRARDVESYMDWFEGTQMRTKSGAFDDYHRAVEEMEALEIRKRSDPISRYLDALEKEF